MKVAVLSDIHANQVAFLACMDYLKKKQSVEAIILLGDYISDCPYPQRTVELLYELKLRYPCYLVRGNREEYILDYQNNPKKDWDESSSTGSLLYTYNNLSGRELDFFRSLPITDVVQLENCEPLRICHGSPMDTRELLFSDNGKAEFYLSQIRESYLLSGHTHTQCEVHYQKKVLWNPGALGMPFGTKRKAIFSILTSKVGGWDCEWIQIPYNIEAELKQFEESGLNRMAKVYALVTRLGLQTGKNILLETVTLAKSLAKQEGVKVENLKLPEKYWEEAAHRLKIL